MSQVGQLESETQNRVAKLFQKVLDYRYFGNWEEREMGSKMGSSLR